MWGAGGEWKVAVGIGGEDSNVASITELIPYLVNSEKHILSSLIPLCKRFYSIETFLQLLSYVIIQEL